MDETCPRDESCLRVEQPADGVIRLVIDRPPANALHTPLIRAIADQMTSRAGEAAPPAIILGAAGDRFFCAGGDIREYQDRGAPAALARMEIFDAMLVAIETYPGPVIAAVRGYAVGGGLELALFSDRVIASANATFGFPEINHGLLPAARGMRQAARLVGHRVARDLLYSGTLIPAAEAERIGLIDRVFPAEEVDAKALEAAVAWRSKDPVLFGAIKRTLRVADGLPDEALRSMTLDDMAAYLARAESDLARERFLNRRKR